MLCENAGTVQTKRISRSLVRAIVGCALLVGTTARSEKTRVPPPPEPAQSYEMQDPHPKEHVTIAAEPGDIVATRPHTRLDYYGHMLLPIRLIVTNDSEFAVSLDDARIHVITADNTVLDAATLDEMQRRIFTMKSATGTKLPLGLPIPITVGKKDINKDILADDHDFGFQSTTVKPHTTEAGYLFYDMEGVSAPFLDHATLELRKVRLAGTGQALESFEIALRPAKGDGSKGAAK